MIEGARGMSRKPVLALAALALACVWHPAAADQTDQRLDPLFDRLKSAQAAEAATAQREIWRIWIDTPDSVSERLMRQGIGAMAAEELAAARRIFDRLIEREPDFAEAWNKRATVHYLMGNFSASVSDIQKTLELEPRHFGALSGLGLIYDAIGEPEAAIRSFNAALEINPHLDGTRDRIEELSRTVRGRRI
jgi:tetratricopeptide (TPR) repeat protein